MSLHQVIRCGSPTCFFCHCPDCEVARRSIRTVMANVDEPLVMFEWFVPGTQFHMAFKLDLKKAFGQEPRRDDSSRG